MPALQPTNQYNNHNFHRTTVKRRCEYETKIAAGSGSLMGRTLHLIDIENLAGTGFCMSEHLIGHVLDRYKNTALWNDGDLTSIAVNSGLLGAVAFATSAWTQKSLHGATGKDGADLVLLQHANQRKLLAGVDRVVIGSGDGIFSRIIETARSAGTHSWVVAAPSATSHRLRLSADKYVPFQLSSPLKTRCRQQPTLHQEKEIATAINQPSFA